VVSQYSSFSSTATASKVMAGLKFSEAIRMVLRCDGLATARGSFPLLKILGPGRWLYAAGQAKAALKKSGPETVGPAAIAPTLAVRLPVPRLPGTVVHPPERAACHWGARSELALRFAVSAFSHTALARFTSAAASESRCANWHWSPFMQCPFWKALQAICLDLYFCSSAAAEGASSPPSAAGNAFPFPLPLFFPLPPPLPLALPPSPSPPFPHHSAADS
jgi:hypothetical protein